MYVCVCKYGFFLARAGGGENIHAYTWARSRVRCKSVKRLRVDSITRVPWLVHNYIHTGLMYTHTHTWARSRVRWKSVKRLIIDSTSRCNRSQLLRSFSKSNSVCAYIQRERERECCASGCVCVREGCCSYGVATISRLLEIIGLFCKRAL